MADLRPQLLGRGTYGPLRSGPRKGPMHLWDHVSMPPAQNSILIYTDGRVVEGSHFDGWQIAAPDVHLFIYGGANIRCDDLDQFSRDALMAAGYRCGFGPDMDVYDGSDQYTETYTVEGTT